MAEYIVSPQAVEDLQAIWNHIANDSIDAANQVVDNLFAAFQQLADWPELGHPRQDLTKRDVRFWPVGKHLVIYRVKPMRVEVVAVLHGARDIPPIVDDR
jgi:plasmid stabilization system protein ParE